MIDLFLKRKFINKNFIFISKDLLKEEFLLNNFPLKKKKI